MIDRTMLSGLLVALALALLVAGARRVQPALHGISLAGLLRHPEAVSSGDFVAAARDAAEDPHWQTESATAFLILAERADQRGSAGRNTYLEGAIRVLRSYLDQRPADGVAWARLAWATSFFAERGDITDHALQMAERYAPYATYLVQLKFESAARAWPDLSDTTQQSVLRVVREARQSREGSLAIRRGYGPAYSKTILNLALRSD